MFQPLVTPASIFSAEESIIFVSVFLLWGKYAKLVRCTENKRAIRAVIGVQFSGPRSTRLTGDLPLTIYIAGSGTCLRRCECPTTDTDPAVVNLAGVLLRTEPAYLQYIRRVTFSDLGLNIA